MLATQGYGLDDLRDFALIADAGGISAASRKFGVPKASLSRSLARLEAAAGLALFDRAGRRLRMTPAGDNLRPTADAVLALMHEAEEILRSASSAPRGVLRIAASALGGQQLLSPVVAKFAADYPQVRTELVVTGLGPDPLVEELDLVLRVGRPSQPYLVARRILGATLRLYASADTDAALSDPAAIEALGRIVIDVEGVPSDWVLRGPGGRELRLMAPPMALVGDPAVALSILEAGRGVALLPDSYGDPAAKKGRLSAILPEFCGPEVEIYAVMPPGRARVPAVRAFLDVLYRYARELESHVG